MHLLADILVDSSFGARKREELFDAVDNALKKKNTKDKNQVEFPAEFIRKQIPFMPSPDVASEMIRKVSNYQKRCVKSYFEGEYQDIEHDRVRVGTIHSSKGREADYVYVATDLKEKVVEHMSSEVTGGIEYDPASKIVPILTDSAVSYTHLTLPTNREV